MSNKTNTVYSEMIVYCTFDIKGEQRQVTISSTAEMAQRNKELFNKYGYQSFIVKAKIITEENIKLCECYVQDYDLKALIDLVGNDDFKSWCAKVFKTNAEQVIFIVENDSAA